MSHLQTKPANPKRFSSSQMFDCDGVGSLSAVELSDLMGALVGIRQHNTTALYTELARGRRPTEGESSLAAPLFSHTHTHTHTVRLISFFSSNTGTLL